MALRWPKSRQMEFDGNGERAQDARCYFYLAGTTTPLAVYQDADLTQPHAHPVHADGIGRWPDVFIPYSTTKYKERATTNVGATLWTSDNLDLLDQVEAASETVLTEQKWQTGQVVFEFIQGIKTGFVRANGRTIGSATSGATERANADTQPLFIYLYNAMTDAQAPVSGGRGGGGAAADFAANKTITLPDMRASSPVGLDDMGNAARGAFAGIPFE